MRADLDQERRAAERAWASRTKQIDAVTFNISGMYGDLQGLVPSLAHRAAGTARRRRRLSIRHAAK